MGEKGGQRDSLPRGEAESRPAIFANAKRGVCLALHPASGQGYLLFFLFRFLKCTTLLFRRRKRINLHSFVLLRSFICLHLKERRKERKMEITLRSLLRVPCICMDVRLRSGEPLSPLEACTMVNSIRRKSKRRNSPLRTHTRIATIDRYFTTGLPRAFFALFSFSS